MIQRIQPAVAPAYLFLCLLLGGSPQGIWSNAILQLLAIALIAWALIERRDEFLPRPVKQLLILISLAVGMVLIQLIPLPVSLWSALPGRDFVTQGFKLLGVKPDAMPISLSPYDTIATLPAFLPSLGMLAATIGLRAYRKAWLAGVLIAGAAAGILLGILQVNSPAPEQSPWYLFNISSFGVATGFFANGNHMATLLLIAIPFTAATGVRIRERSSNIWIRLVCLALAASGLALAIFSLILNQSLAGYGLGVPVVFASLLILFGPPSHWARGGLLVTGLISFAAMIALLWAGPISQQLDRIGASTSITSHQQIIISSLSLAQEFAPVGTGLGTFTKVYPLLEDPRIADRFYVNHAHNDYIELAVEMGLPGIILIFFFLIWWWAAVWRMLCSPAVDQFAIAGAIASATILLHSIVDYPLRTAAISAVFAMCLALILQSRKNVRSEHDLRLTRHMVVG